MIFKEPPTNRKSLVSNGKYNISATDRICVFVIVKMYKYLLFAMLLEVYEREYADVLMVSVIFPVAVYCSAHRLNRVVYGKNK